MHVNDRPMFNPHNITMPSYFFVVDSAGHAWTDSMDYQRAENAAVMMRDSERTPNDLAFYVVDAYQVRFEATATEPHDTPFLDAYGAYWMARPASDCRAFLLCDREATRVIWSPPLGDVPACDRCATKLGHKPCPTNV